MGSDVLRFDEVDRTQVAMVGGKGAHLGELVRVEGVRVPPGFCVTTDGYRRALGGVAGIDGLLDRLAALAPDDRTAIAAAGAEVRAAIEAVGVPDDLAAAIREAIARLGTVRADEAGAEGAGGAYAVRSSATAEDTPTASFAGQQDTYLNVVGADEVVRHVGRCWASLFTERAIAYRLRNRVDHRAAHMAVVVQRMVAPDASGVLFTADPLTSHRGVATVEAVLGLGEALVSGLVGADAFTVRDGEVVARSIAPKAVALHAAPGGGTEERPVDAARRDRPALTDDQALRLVALGRRVEAHLGHPQDIEWCLAGDDLLVVQSRPITTLFPIPEVDDDDVHVYVSVGHQQMMTDAMTPLGLSFWQMTTPRPMAVAGGRLFVDVTPILGMPAGREALVDGLGKSDPLIGGALRAVVERPGFLPPLPDGAAPMPRGTPTPGGADPSAPGPDPALVPELIAANRASITAAARSVGALSGPALIDHIREDMDELRRRLFDQQGHELVMAGMEATWWLNERLGEWLGERNVADTLTLSVPHNVTSEMGLALLDVADAVRPHPEVVAFLEDVGDDGFLDRMDGLAGGPEARDAIRAFLATYGMRCVGEIDITRPRWGERPTTLVPLILGNVRNAEPGEGVRRFEEGRRQAAAKEREVLERLRALPDGERRAADVKVMIDRVRAFSGYREHPKYAMVSRYSLYKQALVAEAGRLVEAGALRAVDDAFFLSFDELGEVVRTRRADLGLIAERRAAFARYQALTPPRVFTSEGEVVTGSYGRDDLPDGALAGLAVSSGVVEGRARVVVDLAQADVVPGDILVTAYTDPSWSPLFVAVAGLVTEVGGLMTHGAVVAREYGLPAVVGVEGATRLIRDGQRVRVHGTDGYVELLT